jgi:hypothetical protein
VAVAGFPGPEPDRGGGEIGESLASKGAGKLVPVVTLELPDPEGKRAAQLAQKRQARALAPTTIEPQDAKPRAVSRSSRNFTST